MTRRASRPQENRIVSSPGNASGDLLSPRAFLVAAAILAAIVFAVYVPALRYQFILDDHRFVNDARVQSSGHLWEYFTSFVWAQFTGGAPSFYRPLFLVWMRINFILSETSSWGWHLISILKHLAVAVLLGVLVWRLLRDRAAALLAATLFALHPAHTESVAWVTVPDPLMSIFILGTLLFYLRYTEPDASDQTTTRPRKAAPSAPGEPPLYWLLLSAGGCFAALLTKETAMVTPGMIFVLALVIPQQNISNRGKNGHATFPLRLGHALRRATPFVAVTFIYLMLRRAALNGTIASATQHLTWKTVLLSWPGVLWFYVRALLWPIQSYSFADPTLAGTLSVNGVLLPALAVLCAAAVLALAVMWAWRKSAQLDERETSGIDCALVIGTLLLTLPLLPALNLNALNPGDFLHGRYTYLPSAGLMLIAATLWHLAGSKRIVLLCAGGMIAVGFAIFTFKQETQWQDDLAVFTIAHELAPHNAPVALNLANAHVQAALRLDEEGRCNEAMPVFEQVALQYPDDWYAWAGMGDCYAQQNNFPKAEESLHRAADLSHNPQVVQQWQRVREGMGLPAPAVH